MTILEALQASIEYSETNVLEKAILDAELTGSDTYSAEDKDGVDHATALVMRVAARTPDFKEGSRFIKWDSGMLLREASRIMVRLGLETTSQPGIKSTTSM